MAKQYRNTALAVLAIIALLALYRFYSPLEHSFFPQCPFRWLTGFKCPGCGSQRALHELLNLNPAGAFHFNPLMVIALPYLLLVVLAERIKYRSTGAMQLRNMVAGHRTILLIFIVVVAYGILRNLYGF